MQLNPMLMPRELADSTGSRHGREADQSSTTVVIADQTGPNRMPMVHSPLEQSSNLENKSNPTNLTSKLPLDNSDPTHQ